MTLSNINKYIVENAKKLNDYNPFAIFDPFQFDVKKFSNSITFQIDCEHLLLLTEELQNVTQSLSSKFNIKEIQAISKYIKIKIINLIKEQKLNYDIDNTKYFETDLFKIYVETYLSNKDFKDSLIDQQKTINYLSENNTDNRNLHLTEALNSDITIKDMYKIIFLMQFEYLIEDILQTDKFIRNNINNKTLFFQFVKQKRDVIFYFKSALSAYKETELRDVKNDSLAIKKHLNKNEATKRAIEASSNKHKTNKESLIKFIINSEIPINPRYGNDGRVDHRIDYKKLITEFKRGQKLDISTDDAIKGWIQIIEGKGKDKNNAFSNIEGFNKAKIKLNKINNPLS